MRLYYILNTQRKQKLLLTLWLCANLIARQTNTIYTRDRKVNGVGECRSDGCRSEYYYSILSKIVNRMGFELHSARLFIARLFANRFKLLSFMRVMRVKCFWDFFIVVFMVWTHLRNRNLKIRRNLTVKYGFLIENFHRNIIVFGTMEGSKKNVTSYSK